MSASAGSAGRDLRWGLMGAVLLGLALILSALLLGRALRLPAYALEVRAGDRAAEGGAAPPRLAEGMPLRVLLRPQVALRGEVAASAYLVRGGQARRWPVRFARAESGALLLQGYAEDLLPIEPGPVELVFILGRPREVPSYEEAMRGPRGQAAPPWQVLRRKVIYEGRPRQP